MELISIWDKRMELIDKDNSLSPIGKAWAAQRLIDRLYNRLKVEESYAAYHDRLNPFARVSESSASVLIMKEGRF